MLESNLPPSAPNDQSGDCPHRSRAYYRQPWASGGGFHVVEACVNCGANVRGAGRWVPRSEVLALGLDAARLPLASSRQRPDQADLFGGLQ
jgi:hypothetical protein